MSASVTRRNLPIERMLWFALGFGSSGALWLATSSGSALRQDDRERAESSECTERTALVESSERTGRARQRPVERTSSLWRPRPTPPTAYNAPTDAEACDCAVVRQAWPSELAERYSPDAFSQAVGEVLSEAAPGVAFELDCEEFPCLALIMEERLDHTAHDVIQRRLLDEKYSGAESHWAKHVTSGRDGPAQVESIAVFPPEFDTEELRVAVDRRLLRYKKAAQAQATGSL